VLSIAEHIFAENPERYRSDEGLSDSVPRGVPPEWEAARIRLENGDPQPVTMTGDYVNYLLASPDSILKRYSEDVERYQKANLLPEHTANLKNGDILYDYNTRADKVSFVAPGIPNQEAWQDALMQFNAALGTELQGDMHVVVVKTSQIDNPDAYLNALMAYWQGPEFGKWGLAKNGIVLVLGLDDTGSTVEWARAKTGMPIGNGEMLAALQFKLPGEPFDPQGLFGHPTGTPYVNEKGKTKARYTHTDGAIEQIVFSEFPFARACMDCKDATDHGTSYTYLKSSIPVSTAAKVWMLVIVAFISIILWLLFAGLPFFEPLSATDPRSESRSPTTRYRNSFYLRKRY
jgi:hypothetical protein